MRWPSIAGLRGHGKRRGADAGLKRALAYRNIFGSADGKIVLADIANRTGFFRVNGPDITAEQRAFSDGMRAVYGQLLPILNLSDIELGELAEAARREAIADAEEGFF